MPDTCARRSTLLLYSALACQPGWACGILRETFQPRSTLIMMVTILAAPPGPVIRKTSMRVLGTEARIAAAGLALIVVGTELSDIPLQGRLLVGAQRDRAGRMVELGRDGRTNTIDCWGCLQRESIRCVASPCKLEVCEHCLVALGKLLVSVFGISNGGNPSITGQVLTDRTWRSEKTHTYIVKLKLSSGFVRANLKELISIRCAKSGSIDNCVAKPIPVVPP